MVRTYEEAAQITAEWWCKKSFGNPLNQDAGDLGINTLLLQVSEDAQKNIEQDQIDIFKASIVNELIKVKERSTFSRMLQVDYDPCRILYKACKDSGINSRCLPVKTFTKINVSNEIEGRNRYGSEWFKI